MLADEDIFTELIAAGAIPDAARRYVRFCRERRTLEVPFETHHILQRATWPQEDKTTSNCVALRPADHLKAHYLLVMALPDHVPAILAFNYMMKLKGAQKLREGGYSEEEIDQAARAYERANVIARKLAVGQAKKLWTPAFKAKFKNLMTCKHKTLEHQAKMLLALLEKTSKSKPINSLQGIPPRKARSRSAFFFHLQNHTRYEETCYFCQQFEKISRGEVKVFSINQLKVLAGKSLKTKEIEQERDIGCNPSYVERLRYLPMTPIEKPDTSRTDRDYWETVLTSHGLDAEAGRPPRFWGDRGEPSEKLYRRIAYVGTTHNLIGKEHQLYRARKGYVTNRGKGPDSFEPRDPNEN